MPVKRTAWACVHKCGRHVTTHKDDVLRHEQHCFMNPENRACRSCGLNRRTEDEGIYCEGDHLPDGKNAVRDCEHWEKQR